MYDSGSNTDPFLSPETQQTFIDEVVISAIYFKSPIPSLRANAINLAVANRFPRLYKSSTGQKLQFNTSSMFWEVSDANKLVSHMRTIIRHNAQLSEFQSFYFVTTAFGFKEKFSGSLLGTQIDPAKIADVCKDVFVDLGYNVYLESATPTIPLRRYSHLPSLCTPFINHRPVQFMPHAHSLFGGISAKPKGEGCRIKKLIAYSDLKYPFVVNSASAKPGRLGQDWEAVDLHQSNAKLTNLIVSYQRAIQVNLDIQFTFRTEIRVPISHMNRSMSLLSRTVE